MKRSKAVNSCTQVLLVVELLEAIVGADTVCMYLTDIVGMYLTAYDFRIFRASD